MLRKRAQSLTEYGICLTVILLAFITVNIYVKRGLQGRYKDLVDNTTTKVYASKQYEPYYQDSKQTNDLQNREIRKTLNISGNFEKLLPTEAKMSLESKSIEGAKNVR